MSKTKVELKYAGFNEYRKSGEMEGLVSSVASGVQTRVGDGYTMYTRQESDRVAAIIYASTAKAYQNELESNALLKAVSG